MVLGTAVHLKRFKFQRSAEAVVAFPEDGMSSIMLPRKNVLSKLLDLLLVKRKRHLYFRGPAGSGKTQLLNCLAQELLKRDHSVYFFPDSKELRNLAQSEFQNLDESAAEEKKIVFLLIDEVRGEMKHDVLLLKTLKNIVTVGAGIYRLDIPSPAFQLQYEPNFIMIQRDELDDFMSCFKVLIPAGNCLEDSQLKYVLERVLQYTGGHLYPFVKLTEHLLSHHTVECQTEAFMTTLMKLGSDSEHLECYSVFENIVERAYGAPLEIAINVLSGQYLQDDLLLLSNLGYWNISTRNFVSDFLVTVLLSKCVPISNHSNPKLIDFNDKSSTPIEQVVSIALSEMDESDFIDPNVHNLRLENSFSFALGVQLSSIQGLYVCFQSRASTGSAGHPPTVYLYLNGRIDAYLEVVLNATEGSLAAHLNRFQKGGAYSHLKNTTLLNIDTFNSLPPRMTHRSILTFVKQENSLFKGTQLLKSNLSFRLSAPKNTLSKIRHFFTKIYTKH